MFTIRKFIGHRGSCRCLWRLTLWCSLWSCMSTIAPGKISALKGIVSPGFWVASPFSPLGKIRYLGPLHPRKSSIHWLFFLCFWISCFVDFELLGVEIRLIWWVGCRFFVICLYDWPCFSSVASILNYSLLWSSEFWFFTCLREHWVIECTKWSQFLIFD